MAENKSLWNWGNQQKYHDLLELDLDNKLDSKLNKDNFVDVTLDEYNAMETHDPDTYYNIIDDVVSEEDYQLRLLEIEQNVGNLEELTTEDKTNIVNAINEVKVSAGGSSAFLPVGVIMPTANPVIPRGWLLCDGSEVYRKTYPELFAALGTYHGSGDGVNTFNLPDMRNRTPIGISDEIVVATTTCNRLQTSVTVTATVDFKFKYKAGDTISFGSENRTIISIIIVDATALTYKIDFDTSFTGDIAVNDTLKIFNTMGCVGGEVVHTLTVDEMPSHSHTFERATRSDIGNTIMTVGYENTLEKYTTSVTTTSTGGSQAHNIMQPYTAINYIIYAGQKTLDDGEQVIIKLPDTLTNIPETNVMLINDSDNSLNKNLTISSEYPVVTIIVPVGDTYHIEYSDVSGYIKPNNTIPKKAIENKITEITIDYIPIEYNLNIVTILNNSDIRVYRENYEIFINTDESNSVTISLPSGEWNIEVVDIDCKETEIVTLDSDYTLDFNTRILGIKRDITSTDPAWERTHSSIGRTVLGSVGSGTSTTVFGYSDFDNTAIFGRIKRVTLPTEDVMVEIPKFYYKRYIEENIEYIQISYGAQEGFELHPAFNHGNMIKDKIYVSAYLVRETTITDAEGTSIDILDSKSGNTESYNTKLSTFRTKAMAKGDGWALWDMSTLSAIQILMLIEFSTFAFNNVLGRGSRYYNKNRGDWGDTVYGLTGTYDDTIDTNYPHCVIWRGIEHIYGADRKWIDGMLIDSDNKMYVCNDITKYSDTITEDYVEIPNYIRPLAQALVTSVICEPTMSYIMLPKELSGTTYETYTCSKTEFVTASYVQALVYEGANSIIGEPCGLMSYGDTRPTTYDSYTSTRLIYIPQE